MNFIKAWWRSRRARVRQLESEIARLRGKVAHFSADASGSHRAGMYWAQMATTSITWNVILWHVRQRTTKKRRETNPLARFVDNPTEDEALEVLRDMWRNPPVFAPPDEAKALASQIVALHTTGADVKKKVA